MPHPPESAPTLFATLVAAGRRYGWRHSGRFEDMKPGRYSYAELLKMTLALGRLGCKVSAPGEHVGVLMPNLMATAALIIGLSAFRRVPCLLNYSAGAAAIQSACETARIRTLITSRQFVAKAELTDVLARLQGLDILYLEDLRPQFGLRDKLWLIAFALPFPERAVPRGDPEAPAVVLFTSGTEGRPKGVVLSHRALLANVAQIREVLDCTSEDTVLNCLPMFHSFGLTAGTLAPLFLGLRLMLYVSPLHYKVIPELIRDKRCTVLFSTSTFLQHYARQAGPGDFSSLRRVVAGAERLVEPVRQAWRERFGIEVYEGYGVTEMAPVISVNTPEHQRAGSVGRALTGIETRLVPVPGIERGGSLHVRGPNLMSGYYRHAAPGVLEPPASALGPGWHDTGDVVEIDAEGYLHIVGRLKRFAKIGGEMVPLELTEAIAREASPEALHAAINLLDAERGERIVLFTTDPGLTRERLVAVLNRQGGSTLTLPSAIEVLDNLPLLAAGKVDYLTLQGRAQGGGA